MDITQLAEIASYATSVFFFVSAGIILSAKQKLGQSALGTVFSYLFIGTGVFFVVTFFLRLGPDFFGVADSSLDIWWHLMFYMAMISYYFGFKALAGLGMGEVTDPMESQKKARNWGIFVLLALVVIFIIPKYADDVTSMYTASPLASFGLHHFIAFVLAGTVGWYLLSAKRNLGQIGHAIATPMIFAIWALALQHLWELFNESWKVIHVVGNMGEIVERFILIVASVFITYAALRLKKFATGS